MTAVYIDRRALHNMIVAPGSQGFAWQARLSNRVKNGAQLRANVRSGRMRADIRPEMLGGGNSRVGTNVRYAAAVHNGSVPHDIRAKPGTRVGADGRRRGYYLRFQGTSGIVYTKAVRHPGYRGNPFLLDALREEINRL